MITTTPVGLPGQARTESMTPRVKEGKGSEHHQHGDDASHNSSLWRASTIRPMIFWPGSRTLNGQSDP
jgi:hypothetical protein